MAGCASSADFCRSNMIDEPTGNTQAQPSKRTLLRKILYSPFAGAGFSRPGTADRTWLAHSISGGRVGCAILEPAEGGGGWRTNAQFRPADFGPAKTGARMRRARQLECSPGSGQVNRRQFRVASSGRLVNGNWPPSSAGFVASSPRPLRRAMTDRGRARLSRPSNGRPPEVGQPEQNILIYMKMESATIRSPSWRLIVAP